MTGSKTNAMKREAVLKAARAVPADKDFVWDGKDEDDRPATAAELATALKKRGRPVLAATKQQVAIRFDADVLAGLRATGRGWQTRVNEAMREWLRSHST